MNRTIPLLIAAACAGLLAREASAQAVVKTPGYDAFRLVKTRNIFDPNRRAVRIETPSAVRTNTSRRPRSSSVSLTGTMITEGRSLAFFSGSRGEYSKVISVGDTVADFKITAIHPSQVEIERGGKPAVLLVGQQLQLEGSPGDASEPAPGGEESPEAPVDGAAPAVPVVPSAPVTTAAPSGAAPPADKNEVLRRMMERRQKEMSK